MSSPQLPRKPIKAWSTTDLVNFLKFHNFPNSIIENMEQDGFDDQAERLSQKLDEFEQLDLSTLPEILTSDTPSNATAQVNIPKATAPPLYPDLQKSFSTQLNLNIQPPPNYSTSPHPVTTSNVIMQPPPPSYSFTKPTSITVQSPPPYHQVVATNPTRPPPSYQNVPQTIQPPPPYQSQGMISPPQYPFTELGQRSIPNMPPVVTNPPLPPSYQSIHPQVVVFQSNPPPPQYESKNRNEMSISQNGQPQDESPAISYQQPLNDEDVRNEDPLNVDERITDLSQQMKQKTPLQQLQVGALPQLFAPLMDLNYDTIQRVLQKNIKDWKCEDVVLWLRYHGYPENVIAKIYHSQYDGFSFMDLSSVVEMLTSEDIDQVIAESIKQRILDFIPESMPSMNDEERELKIVIQELMATHYGGTSVAGRINPIPVSEASLWNVSKMEFKHLDRIEAVKRKLKIFGSLLSKEQVSIIAQNYTFPHRFLYKYLNPKRLPQYGHAQTNGEEFLKIKLVMMKQSPTSVKRQLNMNPLLKNKMTTDVIQCALLVGPWLIEWTDYAMAIVRSQPTFTPLSVIELGTIRGDTQVKLAVRNLASFCSFWTVEKQYTLNKYNTLQFCHYALMFMQNLTDKSPSPPNAILIPQSHLYLSALKEESYGEMSFTFQEISLAKQIFDRSDCIWDLKNELSKSNFQRIKFHSHHMLDEFVKIMQRHLPNYFTSTPTGRIDYELLRGFDRAFWIQENSKPKNQNVIQVVKCPFKTLNPHPKEIHVTSVDEDYRFVKFITVEPTYESVLKK
ncbi:hypothetical protein C9374_006495 [Naegleria lovaniensis]|uniref:SAM domain-containing protein n=1 Tax=Naegleria lovaniensis TaxID=51637 RepID=A0AA88GLW1_NAELO|nr:uncharacterized protein C9374_006495 [Naegleria lovaniensis]KAG2381506.1 hypothetical protein C9374_006495 [Naegleria lovaniensis]